MGTGDGGRGTADWGPGTEDGGRGLSQATVVPAYQPVVVTMCSLLLAAPLLLVAPLLLAAIATAGTVAAAGVISCVVAGGCDLCALAGRQAGSLTVLARIGDVLLLCC